MAETGFSRISPRAYMSDASFRIMKFLESKLKTEDGHIDDDQYELIYNLMIREIPASKVLERIEQLYKELFEETYNKVIDSLEHPKPKEDEEDKLVE